MSKGDRDELVAKGVGKIAKGLEGMSEVDAMRHLETETFYIAERVYDRSKDVRTWVNNRFVAFAKALINDGDFDAFDSDAPNGHSLPFGKLMAQHVMSSKESGAKAMRDAYKHSPFRAAFFFGAGTTALVAVAGTGAKEIVKEYHNDTCTAVAEFGKSVTNAVCLHSKTGKNKICVLALHLLKDPKEGLEGVLKQLGMCAVAAIIDRDKQKELKVHTLHSLLSLY
jgi:hypothetical protein